jgi:dCTP deaminase
MILTGPEIRRCVRDGTIMIDPFDPSCLEPNSYCFHLGSRLIVYRSALIDYRSDETLADVETIEIPAGGYILKPLRFYLGHTLERMGSLRHASELYARLSTSLASIFIQTSAPLGHTGAVIPWTLEIMAIHAVRIYAGMPIGKICFWENFGAILPYAGRYSVSTTVVQSRLSGTNP